MTKAQKANSYEDDDFRQALDEYEALAEEREEIMASARGKVSAIAKRQKNHIKSINKELGIPSATFRTVLKQRALERKLQQLAEDVPADEVELYADASGQFSFLRPGEDDGDEKVVTPAQLAARRAAKKAAENEEAEQREGAEVLNELAGEQVH